MNIGNINKAIAVMERAKAHNSLNMRHWQGTPGGDGVSDTDVVYFEQELHACGNTGCFAGHIAISPEFLNDGGRTRKGTYGCPELKGLFGDDALTQWFELDNVHLMELLVYNNRVHLNSTRCGTRTSNIVYGKDWADVEPDDIIRVLKELISQGEGEFVKRQIQKMTEYFKGEGFPSGEVMSGSPIFHDYSYT